MKLATIFLFFFLCAVPFIGNAQKLVLTREGIRSSDDKQSKYVEYASKEFDQKEMFEHCSKLLSGIGFLSYNVEKYKVERIIVDGYIDGASLLVFGNSAILFKLCFEFVDQGVKVSADLTKTNGKELNYGILFTKTDKVRFAAPKNKIETDINTLINKIIGNIVAIK